MNTQNERPPLARGSISLRLYPHDLDPPDVVQEVAAQSALAEQAGLRRGHDAGAPRRLPELPAEPVADGDVGAGRDRRSCGRRRVRSCCRCVRGRSSSRTSRGHRIDTPAVSVWASAREPFPSTSRWRACRSTSCGPASTMRCRVSPRPCPARPSRRSRRTPAWRRWPKRPVPLVVAAQGPLTVRRAARLGLGVIYSSLQGRERTRELSTIHADNGGVGARILIRRVWLGEPPSESVDAQMARYRAVSPADLQEHWDRDGGLLASTDGAELAERIHDEVTGSRCDAVNLRIFQAGHGAGAGSIADRVARRRGAPALARRCSGRTPDPSVLRRRRQCFSVARTSLALI